MIADKSVGGTHMTLLFSIVSLNKEIFKSLSLYLSSFISYELYFIILCPYYIIMLLRTKSYAIKLDESQDEDFAVKFPNEKNDQSKILEQV